MRVDAAPDAEPAEATVDVAFDKSQVLVARGLVPGDLGIFVMSHNLISQPAPGFHPRGSLGTVL